MRANRRIASLGLAGVAVAVATSALAWACVTTSGATLSATPNEGAAGTAVTVSGSSWFNDEVVNISWQNGSQQTVQGLTSANPDSSGSFKVSITIPGSPAGNYYIHADQEGNGYKNAPFHVTAETSGGGSTGGGGSSSGSTSGAEESNGGGSTAGSTSGSSGGSSGGGSNSDTTSGASGSTGSGTTSGSTSGSGNKQGGQTSGSTSGSESSSSGASFGSSSGAGWERKSGPAEALSGSRPASAGALFTADGTKVFGGSVGHDSRDLFAEDKGAAVRKSDGSPPASQPSTRSGAGDVWSGYGDLEYPSLVPDMSAPIEQVQPGHPLGLGVFFLGAGMVGLAAAFFTADTRRRSTVRRRREGR